LRRCPFCLIASGDAPASFVFQDDRVMVFRDANPKAPIHLLVVPRAHVESLLEADEELLGFLLSTARRVALEMGLKRGFRLVLNVGPEGGQTVYHLHLHLLAGRPMGWPPG